MIKRRDLIFGIIPISVLPSFLFAKEKIREEDEFFTGKVNLPDATRWYKNGKLHRVDAPAVEYASDNKFWYRNGKIHRDDGPAVEWANGDKEWFRNGKRHREDGPAVECADGRKYWYREGKRLNNYKRVY